MNHRVEFPLGCRVVIATTGERGQVVAHMMGHCMVMVDGSGEMRQVMTRTARCDLEKL